MMPFITPIIDRNQEDVLYAMANQNATDNLKGAWNISDINRLISNIKYLHGVLAEQNYHSTIIPQSNITMVELPYVTSKIDIVRTNVVTITNSFHKLNHPPINYGDRFDYNDANALEINLKITNELLESLVALYKYSGTFYSGEGEIL